MDEEASVISDGANDRASRKKRLLLFTLAALALGGIVLFLALRPLLMAAHPEEIDDLSYFQGSKDPAQTLDLTLPPRVGNEKLPLIVWIHGGAWKIGDKKDTLGPPFAKQGYAVASLNYRLTPQAKFPAQIQDCKAAIRFLRANAEKYHLDPDRIGVFGMSAGGHLVALLGATNENRLFDDVGGNLEQSSKVQAVCDWCGITDLVTLDKQTAKGRLRLDGDEPDAPVKLFLGDRACNIPEVAKKSSPVTYIDSKSPPFLIMHGDADGVVPIEQSKELYQKLKDSKSDVQFIVVKNGEHNFVSIEALTAVLNFFDSKLRPGQTK